MMSSQLTSLARMGVASKPLAMPLQQYPHHLASQTLRGCQRRTSTSNFRSASAGQRVQKGFRCGGPVASLSDSICIRFVQHTGKLFSRLPRIEGPVDKGPKKEMKLLSSAAALLPFVLAFVNAELPEDIPIETVFHEVILSEEFIKAVYLVYICLFCWGAVIFASMNDPFYESDDYRKEGGNGTQFWMYERAEEAEEASRAELWREDMLREIEGRVGDIKELEEVEEKEKELV